MTKEQLLRLKALLLALLMSMSLSGCGESEDRRENTSEQTNQGDQIDERMFLVAFIEGKAIIYEDTVSASTSIREGWYAKIYDEGDYLYLLQTPTIILRGKENAISFATSVVGEDNLVFMSWSESQVGRLILKPNN